MENNIVTPGVKKVLKYKIKINFDNGASETIYSMTAPNANPLIPGFLGFILKAGHMKEINITKVRTMEIEAYEDLPSIIT